MAENNKKITHMSDSQARLKAYLDNNNVRPVAVAMPHTLHRVLDGMVAKGKRNAGAGEPTSIQTLVSLACSAYYPSEDVKTLPPLAQFPPSRSNADGRGDRRFTWYADIDMFTSMKIIGARFSCSMRQLIISAILERYKHVPEIKALGIETEGGPRWRMPPAMG